MKNLRKIILYLFLFLLSCSSPDQEKTLHGYDILLTKKRIEFSKTGDIKKFILFNKKYLKLFQQEQYKDGIALCYVNFANVYLTAGDFKHAQSFLKKAELTPISPDNVIVNAGYQNISSLLYGILKLSDQSLEANRKAIYFSKKINDPDLKSTLLARAYNCRSAEMARTNKQDSAISYQYKALEVNKSSLYLSGMAEAYLDINKLDSVKIYTDKALDMVKKEDKINASHTYTYHIAGRYYDRINQYHNAEIYYKKALEVCALTNNFYLIVEQFIYQDLSKLYEKTGNTKEEQFYLKQYFAVKNYVDQQQDEITNLIVRDSVANKASAEEKKAKHIWLYFSIFIMFVLVSGILTYKYIRSLTKKKELLKQKNNSLKGHVDNANFKIVMELAKNNDSSFLTKFQELYPYFIPKLLEIAPDLDHAGQVFCAMLKLNFTSKEIANYLSIQHDSVQKRKSRLRKKLNIPSDVDLYHFFRKLS